MALNKETTYMVLNYNASPVSVTTRNGSELVEGGSDENPAALPMTIEEIRTANTNGYAFKYGFLRFEKEFEADIYKELRINNWENILTNQQIEDIILHPTKDGLQKFIDIDNEIYFGRIVGVYMGLKSIFEEISPKVSIIIEQRQLELKKHQRSSDIIISSNINQQSIDQNEVDQIKEQNDMLMKQLEEMKALLSAQMKPSEPDNSKSAKPEETKPNTAKKPVGRPKKTT